MWEPVEVPFQNSQSLTNLPTTDEIRACTDVLGSTSSTKAVGINDDIVVKYGRRVEIWEGQALVLLERYVPEKNDIVGKLHEIFNKMRDVECPVPKFYGSLDGGSLHTFLFSSNRGDKKHLGPFFSESGFIAGLIGNYRDLIERQDEPEYKVRFYEKYLSSVLEGHRFTLTHGDLQQKNIMVMENPSRLNDEGRRSFDVVITDWES
ncbi:phosphotransferase enzyme family protein [Penicillium herquei]|nr:phosphotransferase enzyme family protein [Penicillium herquei]